MERLVSRLREAAPEEASAAAEEIIRRFEPVLRRTWHQGGFRLEYRDFCQQVFVKVFEGLATLRDARAFAGYFYKVARSVAASSARSRAPETALEELGFEPADSFDERLLAAVYVRSYLEELPPREQEVAQRAFLEEQSAEEIAADLHLSASGVRAAKSRALSHLRRAVLRDARILERIGEKE